MNTAIQSVLTMFDGPIPPSPDRRAAMEDVLTAAQCWAAGMMPLAEFARVGVLAHPEHDDSLGRIRFQAWRHADPEDPRKADLMRAITALDDERRRAA